MATIGLSKPYYAIYSNTGSTVSYASGGVMGKATEANIEIETTDDNNLYADNAIAETDRSFAGGTLTLSTDDLSDTVSEAILGLDTGTVGTIDGVTDESVTELRQSEDALSGRGLHRQEEGERCLQVAGHRAHKGHVQRPRGFCDHPGRDHRVAGS